MTIQQLTRCGLRIWAATVMKMRRMHGTSYKSYDPVFLTYGEISLPEWIFYQSEAVKTLERKKMLNYTPTTVTLCKEWLQLSSLEVERRLNGTL